MAEAGIVIISAGPISVMVCAPLMGPLTVPAGSVVTLGARAGGDAPARRWTARTRTPMPKPSPRTRPMPGTAEHAAEMARLDADLDAWRRQDPRRGAPEAPEAPDQPDVGRSAPDTARVRFTRFTSLVARGRWVGTASPPAASPMSSNLGNASSCVMDSATHCEHELCRRRRRMARFGIYEPASEDARRAARVVRFGEAA